MVIKYKKAIYVIVFTFVTILLFIGCNGKSTNIAFSFNTSTPYNSSGEKTIRFNEDFESVTLKTDIQIDTGYLLIQVCDSDNNVVFSEKYTSNGQYDINLKNITANNDYIIKVQTEQTKKVEMEISSSIKLVKDKEKPEVK